MQRKWLLLSLVIAQMWTVIMCKSYYTILAPGTVKSNRNYTVSVTLHDADEPAVIRLGLLRSPSFFTFQDVFLQAFETKSVDFSLPKLSRDYKYELIAESIKGFYFKNSTELLVEDRNSIKIFIQTSKGIYKPGDLVQFRVIILNEHLKPLKLNEPVGVHIQDAKNHRVKQYKNISLIKGLFSGSIQLSEQPNLGIWKIVVSISGKYDLREMKPFKVDRYVLPKFSVHLDSVDDFVHEDEILAVTVYGKYVYGKYVQGNVTVKLMLGDHVFETQTKDIQDYKAKFNISVSNHLSYYEDQPGFDVEATLIDKYTNVALTSKKNIRHHNQRYKIVVPFEEIEFRDNRPYLIRVKVRYLNDTKCVDRTTPIFMECNGKRDQTLLDDQGAASFILKDETDKSVFFFKNTSKTLPNIFYSRQLNDDSLCNLKVKTGKIQIGREVEVEVSSKSYIPYFVYVLMGHGNIIYTKFVHLESGQKMYTIKVVPTVEMVPSMQLCVHYIVQGQLNYCEIKIRFPNEFENKITLSTPNSPVQPGEEVTFDIQAQPQSRVGLLALDLGAHLLNSNYSLNKDDIIRDLLSDQSYTHFSNIKFGQQTSLVIMSNADNVNLMPTVFFGLYRESRILRSAKTAVMQTQIRTKFPETWIFKEIEILNETTSLSLNIPDTITTWLVTAVSVNEESGFGMTDNSLNITVFRSFFISTNLPYAIKRGEIIAIPLTIFNYNEQNINCEVVMNNTEGEFQFVNDEGEDNFLNLTLAKRQVNVLANSGASVKFMVKALKLGQLNVRLTSSSPLASDAVHQQLRVEPEGTLMNDNQEIYLNLETDTVQKAVLKAEIPPDIAAASEFLQLSIGGDVLVPSLKNINKLVLLPTGCGEQNMINLAPNILILDYLKTLNKWHNFTELVVKALGFIETGYQQQLTYRHDSGGYSVFGNSDQESTWLTAYVIRFFIKAVRYVAVEPEVITSGLDFLALKQQTNGEFPYTGHLFNPAHQNRFGFTAFVLLSFMENRKYQKRYRQVIQKGIEFLTSNINNTNDVYALSITAMALQKAQSDKVPSVRDKLLAVQQSEGNRKWWTSTAKKQHSNDVEITAYALMCLLETSGHDHISIFRWLIEQRNGNGGFGTTHDTVVGLQALIKFTEKYNSFKDAVMNITYFARDLQGLEVKKGSFEVTADNYEVLQQQELPHTTRFIQYEATGQGNSLLQLSYQYYVTESKINSTTQELTNGTVSDSTKILKILTDGNYNVIKRNHKQQRSLLKSSQAFAIEPLAKMSSDSEMVLDVCFKYQSSGDFQLQATNMIILNINLPSGFVCDSKTTEELLEEDLVTKVELENSFTKIIIYFDQLKANDRHCLQIKADKVYEVQMLSPSTIEMYDYYNLDLRDIVFYEIKK